MTGFLGFCFSVHAQNITGTVVDTAGNVLAFSTIGLKQKNSNTIANSEGKFSFNVAPGNYTITCQHIGYQSQQKNVEVVSGNSTKLDFVVTRQ